jgi:hypothetical protein
LLNYFIKKIFSLSLIKHKGDSSKGRLFLFFIKI